MATRRTHQKSQSEEEHKSSRKKNQQISRLVESEQVKQLLKYYELSLTETMTAPLFGVNQRFPLSIYDDQHELVSKAIAPTLEHLSQDLGFVSHAGYEAIKSLNIPDMWQKRLLQGTLQGGKNELNRYLRALRPLLMEREIYFYCITPVAFVQTKVETGDFVQVKGKRILSALPMSVQAGAQYGCDTEKLKELAPQVAWLLPMLVVYRKVKDTAQLIAYLDGWLQLLSPQENERMYTAFVKHVPYMINDEVTQLLIAQWEKHR